MKRRYYLTFIFIGLLGLTQSFQNCSEVAFDQKSGTSDKTTDESGGALGQDGSGGTGGTTDPAGTGTGAGGTTGGTTGGTGGAGGTGPVNNPPGGTTPPGGTVNPGTPLAPSTIIPRVVFIGPPCIRGSNCLVAFELDQAYANAVDFDWLTNDTIWTTPSTPIYGKPNYHYVPNSGHITFAPGTIRKEVYVQNINPDNVAILIGLRMRNCSYGGVPANCTSFFR